MSQQPQTLQFATKWEWQEHDGTWIPYDSSISNKIQIQPLNAGYTFTSTNNQSYTITKQTTEYGIQQNDSTKFQRSIRRVSVTDSYVWQYEDDNQNFVDVTSNVSNTIENFMVGSSNQLKIFRHYYQISKSTPFAATQTNLQTNKQRNLRSVTLKVSQNSINNTSNTTTDTTDTDTINDSNNNDNSSVTPTNKNSNKNHNINTSNTSNKNKINDNIQQNSNNSTDDMKTDDNTTNDDTGTKNNNDNNLDTGDSKTDDKQTNNNDTTTNSNNSNNTNIKSNFDTFWQFEENGGSYTDMGSKICQQLDNAQIGDTLNYKVKKHSYSTDKDDDENATQTNSSTFQQRHLRKILFDKTLNKRVILEYQDQGTWYYGYDIDTIKKFENASINSTINYTFRNQNYIITKLSDTTGNQINTSTKYQRKIRRTLIDKSYPDQRQNNISKIRSNFYNYNTLTNGFMPNITTTTTTKRRTKKKKKKSPIVTKNIGKERKDFTFKQALDLFNTSLKGCDIYSIESLYHSNENIYDLLLKNKKNENQPSDTVFAFHGTTWDNISKIKKNGFNRDFNVTSRYGRGTYFAKDASYSDSYTDYDNNNQKCMLVCKIIVGNKIQGNGRMITPPIMNDNVTQYDTLVDDDQNPSIWVVTRDFFALPIYALVYD